MNYFHLQAFAAFDREGVGLITKEDLHQIINAFCFVMSEKQFKVEQLFFMYLCNITELWNPGSRITGLLVYFWNVQFGIYI